ncbi:Hint domain-containing protein [Hyalangium rubrum]|uniref:Hint domain-containing protein n=1 Tax=Hyalangium rubrum TaxID=3103134 RepID=A0ABU5H4X0_9BACT|nr:Hint domain-containing protein [Hyalangium sp. s54d21]MDY7228286.1 Hint domain-containing protein [Hyalangium sp. s54d21]
MKNQKVSKALRSFVSVGSVSAVALLSAGWTSALNPPTASVDKASLLADSQYMSRKFQARAERASDSIRIDLADAAQFRFVENRLKASGKTPKNSPYLFQRLREARLKALANPSRPGDISTQESEAGQWCTHFLYMGNEKGDSTSTTYELTPVVACEGGANYIYTDVIAYDSNADLTDNIPVDSAAGEDYGGGTNFVGDLVIYPTLPADASRHLNTESLMIAMDESTGAEQFTYTQVQSAVTPVKQGIQVFHPAQLLGGAGSDIVICQQRGGSDCDYAVSGYVNGVLQAYPSGSLITGIAGAKPDGTRNPSAYWPVSNYSQAKVYLPVNGLYDAGAKAAECRITQFESAKLRLQLVNTGKVCYVETDFLNQLVSGSRASAFSFLADFTRTASGPGTCNKDTILNEAVTLWMQIKAKADCGGGLIEDRFTSMTSDMKALVTQKIFYRNSCMAEGTSILRADGTSSPIEQLEVGDKVIANDKGVALTVMDIARGGEDKPLVRVRDSAGHDVRLTEQHPVITASGKVVPAVALKVKDQVKAKGGTTTITSIERIPYEGQVFNLTLGTDAELASLSKEERTMFAGGFLVGDNAMQLELETPKHPQVAVMSSLPKVWHKDYLKRLDVKQGAARK